MPDFGTNAAELVRLFIGSTLEVSCYPMITTFKENEGL